MKRLICMLLMLCMIPGTVSCARPGDARAGSDSAQLGALNNQGVGVPLDAPGAASAAKAAEDHLVVHYNFLGDTLDEKLTDKATKGTPDNLTFGNAGNLSRIENGVAYINEASGNYLHVAQVSDEIKNATALTFVTRFKFEGDTPGNLVDMVMLGNNILRWSIIANGTLSATFFTGTAYQCGLGGGTVYTPGQWIDMALTAEYDASAQSVKTSRYVSVDGWKTYIPTNTTKTNCPSNPFAGATNLTLGKNNPSIGDRGRSVAYEDFRIYDQALDIGTISGIQRTEAPAASDNSHLENYLITHYDFLGENLTEQLRDKGTAGSFAENLSLSTTQTGEANDSYIKDGAAYVNRKQGNYLRVAEPGDIRRIQKSMTVFMEFKATIEEPINVGDALVVSNTARIGYFYNVNNTNQRYLYAAAGKNNSGAGPNSSQDMPQGFENGWIRVAYVVEYDSTNGKATITLYYSVNGGETWANASKTVNQSDTVDLTTMFSGATDLILGKVSSGIADRGVSFCYNDVRIYNKALTEGEIRSISPEGYSDYRDTLALHYDFIGNTAEEQLSDKVSGEKLTLSTTEKDGNPLSYVKDGKAYINSASGNYLFAETLPELAGKDGSMTVFTVFRPEGTAAKGQINDLLTIPDTVRLGFYDTTLRPHIRLGKGLDVSHQHSGDAYASTIAEKWVYLAAVLRNDGSGNLSCIVYLSVDGGATWTTYAGYAVSDVLALADSGMMIGKYTAKDPDSGLSYTFDDIRIYSSALTVDQLKTVQVYESPDLSDVDMQPSEDLSLYFYLPEEIAEQYDSVTATAVCMGESTVLHPVETVTRDGKRVLVFRYSELSALMLDEQVTLTVNAERDGKVWHGASRTFSVMEYCYKTIRSADASDNLKKLCVDILNYGAKAQLYFDYHTDTLVDQYLTEDERALGSTGDPAAESITNKAYGESLAEESVLASFYSASVNLRNPIELLFRVATDADISDLTAVVTDLEGHVLDTVPLTEAVSNGDGTYSFGTLAGVRTTVLVTIWRDYVPDGGNRVSNTLSYSAESYAASKMNSENTKLAEMVKAMLRYWDCAALNGQ